MSLIRLLLPSMLLLPAGPRLLSAQQTPPSRQSDTVAIRIDSSGRVVGCQTAKGVACTRKAAEPSTTCSMPTLRPDTARVVPMPGVKNDSLHTQPMPVAVPGCAPEKKK